MFQIRQAEPEAPWEMKSVLHGFDQIKGCITLTLTHNASLSAHSNIFKNLARSPAALAFPAAVYENQLNKSAP